MKKRTLLIVVVGLPIAALLIAFAVIVNAARNRFIAANEQTASIMQQNAERVKPFTAAELADIERKRVENAARTASADAADARRSLTDKWSYSTNTDQMTGKTTVAAWIASENTVNFAFPYAGEQHASLTLINRQTRRDVYIKIERGQFLCPSYADCVVRVRFDEGKPESWDAVGPADHSTTMIFLNSEARFLQRMRAAKVVRIQPTVFREGAPAFEFQVGGFDYKRFLGHQ